ncbi:MAG: hypothetical protein SGPRY_002296 [Prymnesium sp.]
MSKNTSQYLMQLVRELPEAAATSTEPHSDGVAEAVVLMKARAMEPQAEERTEAVALAAAVELKEVSMVEVTQAHAETECCSEAAEEHMERIT